jgi:hypothetical protein
MSTGTADLNPMLSGSGAPLASDVETKNPAARSGPQTPTVAETYAPRHHRLDDNELSGFGRLAAEARTQTSRRSGEDYTVLRIAQNIRAIGSTVVTNYFDLVCCNN